MISPIQRIPGVILFIWATSLWVQASPPRACDLVYRFPTSNHSIASGHGEDFYMYCDRNFEGVKSKPWQAGGYGMVRSPFRTADGSIMYSRMHEGIDIKPMKRDTSGEPQDLIHPIAPGKVVYANEKPGLSNYGRYVVVSHRVPEGIIFSLYAHMARVDCKVGQFVGTGNVLGLMGHSGAGINRERSHVHLEICLLIHSQYDQFCPPANKHGIYNGLNLIGINPEPVLLACKDGQPLSISRHWKSLREHYRVRTPYPGQMPDLLKRYPFLKQGDWSKQPHSLDIALSAEGIPLAVYPSDQIVQTPQIIFCAAAPTVQQNVTFNRVKNSSKDAALTASGVRYIQHLMRPLNTSHVAPKSTSTL